MRLYSQCHIPQFSAWKLDGFSLGGSKRDVLRYGACWYRKSDNLEWFLFLVPSS